LKPVRATLQTLFKKKEKKRGGKERKGGKEKEKNINYHLTPVVLVICTQTLRSLWEVK
jgi:hypothetical protein